MTKTFAIAIIFLSILASTSNALAALPMQQMSLDLNSIVQNALQNLTNDIIGVFDMFFKGLTTIVLNSTDVAISGILGLFGIPFHAWAEDLKSYTIMIPILFVGILGLAGAVGYFFLDVYGFEGDLRGGEEVIGREEENIEEEE